MAETVCSIYLFYFLQDLRFTVELKLFFQLPASHMKKDKISKRPHFLFYFLIIQLLRWVTAPFKVKGFRDLARVSRKIAAWAEHINERSGELPLLRK